MVAGWCIAQFLVDYALWKQEKSATPGAGKKNVN